MTNEIMLTTSTVLPAPAAVANAGAAGMFAWDEFFIATLRNRNTRATYLRAVTRFLAWVEPAEPDLKRITPGLVGRYFDELDLAIPSKKLHLAAIRRFFDVLVQRHVVALNPALSVRNERYSVDEGRTPEIGAANARKLLESITGTEVIDLRDKALIGTLIFSAVEPGGKGHSSSEDCRPDQCQRAGWREDGREGNEGQSDPQEGPDHPAVRRPACGRSRRHGNRGDAGREGRN